MQGAFTDYFNSISLWGNIWWVDVLVQNPLSRSARIKTCLPSLYTLHPNNKCNSSSIEPSLHIGHERSCRFKPDILPSSTFIFSVPDLNCAIWDRSTLVKLLFIYSSTTMLILILLYRGHFGLLPTSSFHFWFSYKLIFPTIDFHYTYHYLCTQTQDQLRQKSFWYQLITYYQIGFYPIETHIWLAWWNPYIAFCSRIEPYVSIAQTEHRAIPYPHALMLLLWNDALQEILALLCVVQQNQEGISVITCNKSRQQDWRDKALLTHVIIKQTEIF